MYINRHSSHGWMEAISDYRYLSELYQGLGANSESFFNFSGDYTIKDSLPIMEYHGKSFIFLNR